MSQENLEIARRYYRLLNARDLDGCSELLAPDLELVQGVLPDGGTYHGIDGWRQWLGGIDEAWPGTTWEVEDLVEAGDHVVAQVRVRTQGGHTGIQQEVHRFHTVRIRDGRIAFAAGYARREQALEAAGLRE